MRKDSAERAWSHFDRLERWLSSARCQLSDLGTIERRTQSQAREMLRLLLQSHLESRGCGDVGPAIVVTQADGSRRRYGHKRLHDRIFVSLFGSLPITRMGYSRPGKASIHPLDRQLQLPRRCYSYEIQRRLVKRAVQGPFDEAVDALFDDLAIRVPKRIAECILIEACTHFDAFYAQNCRIAVDETGPILVGSVDGKGIPMVKADLADKPVRRGKGQKAQRKKMATVGTVFTQHPFRRTPQHVVANLFDSKRKKRKRSRKRPRPENKRVWASLTMSKDDFIADVKTEMLRRDPDKSKTWVVLTDGERALQMRVATLIGPDALLILDIVHAIEKLWTAAYLLHPEGSPQAADFVRHRVLRILQGEVGQVVKGLRQTATKRKRKLRKHERTKLRDIAAYLYRNRTRMRYDDYLRRGLPIASGAVEGACKNLIKDRMERSGMRWTKTMAEAMVKMRALYLSGDFDEYWTFHVKQEQADLYPKNKWKPVVAK